MTATADLPAITRTPAEMITEAEALLSAAGTEDTWPQSRDAQAAIGWARGRLLECLDIHARLLNGCLDPLSVGAPDAGLWSDPEASAIEYTADEALEQAKTLRNRLAEWQRKEEARAAGLPGSRGES